MTDSLEVFSELRQIRAQMEAIEHTQEVLVRAEAQVILNQVWSYMDADPVLARVYLLVDGKRSQQDIADLLTTQGVAGGSKSNVSRKLETLNREMSLVDLVRYSNTGKVYRGANVDRILGIAKKLERRLASATKAPNGTTK